MQSKVEMIAGIGIDIIEVDRVEEKVTKNSGFREAVFSSDEIAFCEARKEKYQHYAARFAAKEAFLKATGLGLTAGHTLSDIEIRGGDAERPSIFLTGIFAELAGSNHWTNIHVSISHLKQMACAVVVIEK